MNPRLARLLCGLIALTPAIARSDDPDPVARALARPILGPRKTLAETQEFVDARIPRMPEVRSADEWDRIQGRLRAEVFEKVIFRGRAAAWRDATAGVEWLETIPGGPGYRIRKLRFEAVPGLWVPALLYEPERLSGRVPVVLNVNGHDSKGKSAPYKQARCINQAKRGMLALNLEWFGMGQLRGVGFHHGLINAIDLCGSGGIATHFLAMKRGLDILLSHPNADPERVGVTGLSGGGWQTIFFSALETRVTLTDPVAGYSSFRTRVKHFSDLGDSEQTPCDLATVVDYTHLTAMMAPRPTLLTFNAKDECCFAAGHALPPLLEAAAPIFALYGLPGRLRAHVNHDPGTHNYLLENREALYQMMADSWSRLDQVYSPREIPSDAEIKPAEALEVPLPADNLDLAGLAARLAADLPRPGGRPDDGAALDSWREQRRSKLRSLVRPFELAARAEGVEEQSEGGLVVRYARLRVGESWTVPVVEIAPKEASGTALVLADGGRASAAARVRALLESGRRVVAIDPFYFGEAHPEERDYLWALLVATVGERPLGLQAGQVIAAARWLARDCGFGPVELVADGRRTGVIARVAAALEPQAIGSVTLHGALPSLKEIIAQKRPFDTSPELFCFGLLEHFDMPQVEALIEPRPIRRD